MNFIRVPKLFFKKIICLRRYWISGSLVVELIILLKLIRIQNTHFRELSVASSKAQEVQADTPPRGWNSYDSFSWIISEEEFLQNAEIVSKRLLSHGYQYVVVDFLWYRKNVNGAELNSQGFDVIDDWGRVIPDPDRWPSSRDGKGFTEVANKVHAMGLKFGIHVMRGISTQAVDANTPIFDTIKGGAYEEAGRKWKAQDIGLRERTCAWMSKSFMSVDTKTGAGRAFLRSLYQQYADWGVDFVKHDCVFGNDFDVDEITVVSEVLKELNHPILYSLSPGIGATIDMANQVSSLVNMYRISGNTWDTWGDVESHFGVSRDYAVNQMIGTNGLKGKSWPDLDMLPLGWLTGPGDVKQGPHRNCELTLDEQKTQMTLWAMAKSPIMYGGDLRNIDEATFNLITDPTLLEINTFSTNNQEYNYKFEAKTHRSNTSVLSLRSQSKKEVSLLEKHSFGLTSCNDNKAKGWVSEVLDSELERICWKDNSRSKNMPQFCLYKKKPLLTSDEEIVYEKQYQGKLHLATETMQLCLDASPNQRLTSRELRSSSFSPCRWHANQMWELNDNGTLVSSYSGLCATVKAVEDDVNSGEVRSWFATGKGDKVYLAVFNLSSEKKVVIVRPPDVLTALPPVNFPRTECTQREVWSGKEYGVLEEKTITVEVAPHGCAIFVLQCK